MSENINRLAVGLWSASVAFQLTTAIYDGWKAWSKWQRAQLTDFERVVNGETRGGWRRVLLSIGYMESEVPIYYNPVLPRLADRFENQEGASPAGYSAAFEFVYPLPNGLKILTIRRCSLIRTVYVDLLKVVFDPLRWESTWLCYLTSRTIAVGFHRSNTLYMRVLLLDAVRRRIRHFGVLMPEENMTACYFYLAERSKPQLHAIFVKNEYEQTETGWSLEFIDAKYDLWSGGEHDAVSALSWESVSIPVGNRFGWRQIFSGSAMTFVFYDEANVQDVDSHLCVSFDDKRTWRVEKLPEWLVTLRNTKTGKCVLEAARSFAALSPPTVSGYVTIPTLEWFDYVFPYLVGGEALGLTTRRKDNILHRWLSPPSLKRLAVEALLKKNPDLKMSAINNAVGFDISDGVTEETEDDVETIHL